MPDPSPAVDLTGISRTEMGEIKDQTLVRREGATQKAETTTSTQEKSETKTEPEAKTEGDKSILNEGKEGETKTAEGAPEKYADFKVPDGFELDPKVAEEAGTLFKSLNLGQEGAQKLIDLYVAKAKEAAEQPYNAYLEMRKGWRDEISSDRDLGHRLPEVRTTISKALDNHLGPKLAGEFREAMDMTGAGDHPAFARGLFKLAQMLVEGTHVSGKGPSKFGQERTNAPQSAAAAVYPHLPSRSP